MKEQQNVYDLYIWVVWMPVRRIEWIQLTQNKALTLFSLSLFLSFHLSQSVWKQLSCLTDRLTYTQHVQALLCESPVLSLSLARAETHVKRKLFPSLCSNSYHTAREKERQMLHISCFSFNHTQCLPFLTAAFMLRLVKDTWMRCFKVLNQFNRHSHMKEDTTAAV